MNNEAEEASLDDIDEYLAVLYEDKMELKIAVTRKILLLTLDMKNIEFLLTHGNVTFRDYFFYFFLRFFVERTEPNFERRIQKKHGIEHLFTLYFLCFQQL